MFIIVSILWYVDFFVFLPLPQCIFSAFLASCVVSASISTKLADAPEGCAHGPWQAGEMGREEPYEINWKEMQSHAPVKE